MRTLFKPAGLIAEALRAKVGVSTQALRAKAADDTGAVGYILAWLLGVPASVLFLIFLMRGCT